MVKKQNNTSKCHRQRPPSLQKAFQKSSQSAVQVKGNPACVVPSDLQVIRN